MGCVWQEASAAYINSKSICTVFFVCPSFLESSLLQLRYYFSLGIGLNISPKSGRSRALITSYALWVISHNVTLLLFQIGVSASYALWAVSHNFTLFVLARIVGGLSKGNVSLSTAIVADIFPPEKRGKGMVSHVLVHCILFILMNFSIIKYCKTLIIRVTLFS